MEGSGLLHLLSNNKLNDTKTKDMKVKNVSEEMINEVWNKAMVVPNVNPASYRKDEFGAWIRRCRYEERDFPLSFGWSIASFLRQDGEYDYQPMQWQNASFSSIPRSKQRVTSEGFYNKYINI